MSEEKKDQQKDDPPAGGSPTTGDDPAAGAAPGATALLVVDMISRWDFPEGDTWCAAAEGIADTIATLKARCRAAGVPVIYANDNRGRWRSDLRQLLAEALDEGGAGAALTRRIAPDDDDYVVLKPQHSAFFATPLALLLEHLGVRRLLLTGLTSDQCILATAIDARMRGLEIVVVRDGVASLSGERNERVLRHFDEVLGLDLPDVDEVRVDAMKPATS